MATTLPEIFVSTIAAMEGHGILVSQVGDYIAASQDKVGMAIGNGIGSVICNTAMILAISIIFMPIAVDKRSFAPKGILLIAAVCALFLLSRSGSLSIAGAAVLLFIFLLYITENIRSAKREAGAEETEEAPASDRKSIVLNILRIVGGAACIVVARGATHGCRGVPERCRGSHLQPGTTPVAGLRLSRFHLRLGRAELHPHLALLQRGDVAAGTRPDHDDPNKTESVNRI